jgi:hypothetical protein
MNAPAQLRYELRHNDAPIGFVRSGGIDWVSEASNDEALFWFGWRALERHVRAGAQRTIPRMPAAWLAQALRHSASLAAASSAKD